MRGSFIQKWRKDNTAISASLRTLIPPQEWLDRKSTGDVTPGWTGYLRRKSSSAGFISLFISRIWGHNKQGGFPNVVFPAQTAFSFPLDQIWTGLLVSGATDSMACLFSKQTMQRMRLASIPTWKASWAMYVSLSHSNRPLVVYWKTEEVMLSIRLDTRCFRASSGSAFRTAFWKTTLNAWGRTGASTTLNTVSLFDIKVLEIPK